MIAKHITSCKAVIPTAPNRHKQYITYMPRVNITPSSVLTKPRRSVVNQSGFIEAADTFASNMHYVAKEIILFTLFYSTANWWLYRRTREDIEKVKNDKKAKDEERRKKTKDIFE